MLKRMLRNWKTTAAGLASICSGVGLIGGAISLASDGKWQEAYQAGAAGIAAIGAGIGLLNAKDSNVTGGTVPNAS